MSALPYLLDSRCLTLTCTEELLLHGLLDLGRITREGVIDSDRLAHAGQCLAPEVRAEWARLLALEWLLARCCGVKAAAVAGALDGYADQPLSEPQPGGVAMPSARQLALSGAAVALVPLAAQDGGPPGLAALIVSPEDKRFADDQRANWQGAEAFSSLDGYRLDVVRTPHAVPANSGTSWQLGAALAARAQAVGDPAVLLDLASAWLPTGSVRADEEIESVGIGNKTDLPVIDRRWMIPAGNSPHEIMRDTGYAHAQSLDIAWNHITRQGTLDEGGSQPWPEGVEELHSFVSGAREPVIAAALLANAPRLVLWRTSNEKVSRKPAEDIRNILREIQPSIDVVLRDIPSGSMHAVEKILETELEPSLREGRFFLFNVTQGTRLMVFAVHTLARRFPAFWMLYRDFDNQNFDFTAIRYDGRDYPVTFVLTADHTLPSDIHLDALKDNNAKLTWQELLGKIRVTTNLCSSTGK